MNYSDAMISPTRMRAERRLAAILVADVAGYSRLMHQDEETTHARLTALLADTVMPAIGRHAGRIIKNTGDGFLAEFPSAVKAVRAAIQFQDSVYQQSIGEVQDKRILFRVGINIGDVIVKADDLFGDGVNIASRLEGVAKPGGICLSLSAYDQVCGKVGVEFTDLGEQNLKNITRPVRVYAVLPDGPGAAAQIGRRNAGTAFSAAAFHCGPSVREYRRKSGAGLFCRWCDRELDHRPVAYFRLVCHRLQYRVLL